MRTAALLALGAFGPQLTGCYQSHAAEGETPARVLALCPDEVQAITEKAAELGCEQPSTSRLEDCPALCVTIDGADVHLDDSVRSYVTTCAQLDDVVDSLCPR